MNQNETILDRVRTESATCVVRWSVDMRRACWKHLQRITAQIQSILASLECYKLGCWEFSCELLVFRKSQIRNCRIAALSKPKFAEINITTQKFREPSTTPWAVAARCVGRLPIENVPSATLYECEFCLLTSSSKGMLQRFRRLFCVCQRPAKLEHKLSSCGNSAVPPWAI